MKIKVNDNDAFKIRLYGYEVENNFVDEQDYQSYIDEEVDNYLASQGLV